MNLILPLFFRVECFITACSDVLRHVIILSPPNYYYHVDRRLALLTFDSTEARRGDEIES